VVLAGLMLVLLGPEAPAEPARGVTALPVEPVAVGARGELSLVLPERVAQDDLFFVWVGPTPLRLAENRLDLRHVVDPQAVRLRLSAPFVAPAQPGDYTVEALALYLRCGARFCRVVHEPVRWTVRVSAGPA
jgi:hypothetical protein